LATLAVLLGACAAVPSSAPSSAARPSASASATPISFDVFSARLCGSFTSLVRAVGNPDAGTPSAMSKALDDAVKARDRAAGDSAADAMLAELESGRQQAAAAAEWAPGADAMRHLDELLVAFEASTTAKRAIAAGLPIGSGDPAKAFESAGGNAAWRATLQGISTIKAPTGAAPIACRAFSGQL
jgi:hypothetical protein